MGNLWYTPDGEPMDDLSDFRRYKDRKIVAKTTVYDAEVSTVWLGLDHQFGDGPPLIFETMVFGGPHNDWTERYPTEDAARAGHDRAVAWLREDGPWCSATFRDGRCMLRPHDGPHRSTDYDDDVVVEWQTVDQLASR